ncbi:unnamed protein product [Adineta steineri]|uniref:Sialidase domain-containing protein n=1 Tax=Adineta steineri TaxID=433720 RepID=A0A816CSN6_9BILA|nr:unnamed protein product [Adineta steineri]CAF1628157.1 unnamed protein product [Adineta steineri]
MLLPILLSLFIYLRLLNAIIPFDGIIHRSTDGTSYAYLSPPKTGNHASFIEQMTPSGTLAIAWFTGGENEPNCSIALSLLHIDSQQFTPGVIVSERANYSNQNPVLFWDNQAQILHLYHSSQLGNAGETNSQIWHVQSKDQGATWSTAAPFYTISGSFDRNRIIPTMNNDGVLFPCYNTTTNSGYSFILRSSFINSSWTRINLPLTNNLIQPSIIRLNNSPQLRSFFRDRNAQSIYYSDSNDDGSTWSLPKVTSLPNNDAGIEGYTLKNGAVLMTFNNLNGTQQPRSPLTIALSYDNGLTWPYKRTIQIHADDNTTYIGEYSYPSLIQTSWTAPDDNDIHLVYTYDRQTIKYVRFNEKWIKQGF